MRAIHTLLALVLLAGAQTASGSIEATSEAGDDLENLYKENPADLALIDQALNNYDMSWARSMLGTSGAQPTIYQRLIKKDQNADDTDTDAESTEPKNEPTRSHLRIESIDSDSEREHIHHHNSREHYRFCHKGGPLARSSVRRRKDPVLDKPSTLSDEDNLDDDVKTTVLSDNDEDNLDDDEDDDETDFDDDVVPTDQSNRDAVDEPPEPSDSLGNRDQRSDEMTYTLAVDGGNRRQRRRRRKGDGDGESDGERRRGRRGKRKRSNRGSRRGDNGENDNARGICNKGGGGGGSGCKKGGGICNKGGGGGGSGCKKGGGICNKGGGGGGGGGCNKGGGICNKGGGGGGGGCNKGGGICNKGGGGGGGCNKGGGICNKGGGGGICNKGGGGGSSSTCSGGNNNGSGDDSYDSSSGSDDDSYSTSNAPSCSVGCGSQTYVPSYGGSGYSSGGGGGGPTYAPSSSGGGGDYNNGGGGGSTYAPSSSGGGGPTYAPSSSGGGGGSTYAPSSSGGGGPTYAPSSSGGGGGPTYAPSSSGGGGGSTYAPSPSGGGDYNNGGSGSTGISPVNSLNHATPHKDMIGGGITTNYFSDPYNGRITTCIVSDPGPAVLRGDGNSPGVVATVVYSAVSVICSATSFSETKHLNGRLDHINNLRDFPTAVSNMLMSNGNGINNLRGSQYAPVHGYLNTRSIIDEYQDNHVLYPEESISLQKLGSSQHEEACKLGIAQNEGQGVKAEGAHACNIYDSMCEPVCESQFNVKQFEKCGLPNRPSMDHDGSHRLCDEQYDPHRLCDEQHEPHQPCDEQHEPHQSCDEQHEPHRLCGERHEPHQPCGERHGVYEIQNTHSTVTINMPRLPPQPPMLEPRTARPPRRCGDSDSELELSVVSRVGGSHKPNLDQFRPPSNQPHRPELGVTSSVDSTPVSLESEIAPTGYEAKMSQRAKANDAEAWASLLHPTKTAHLPVLLNHQYPSPQEIELPRYKRIGTNVRLDTNMAGEVDYYAVPPFDIESPPERPDRIEEGVWNLVESLSLEEKIGQMMQVHVGRLMTSEGMLNHTAVDFWINRMKVGSVFDSPGNARGRYSWYSASSLANVTNSIQKVALAKGSRVPVIWGIDSIRGANYIKGAAMFPVGVGIAATFQPMFAYEASRIAAKDTRAAGMHWVFGPNADLNVEKRWAENYKSYGEDPTLLAEMVRYAVRGFQGDYKADRSRVAAAVRDFIGTGNTFNGKDRSSRSIPDNILFEYYLPAFEAAINSGSASMMETLGNINGESVVESNFYLRSLLRDKLTFRGMLVTDYEEIRSQSSDFHTAANHSDATFLALNNTSIDMSRVSDDPDFSFDTFGLVQNGTLNEDRITESVARILQMKKDLGLFEEPFANTNLIPTVGSKQDIEAAQSAVRESVTLLKNKNSVLPLREDDKVLFIGPHLNSTRLLGGGWNVHRRGPSGEEGELIYDGIGDTIMKGVEQITGRRPVYMEGFELQSGCIPDAAMADIIQRARSAEKIVIGLGEPTYAEIAGDIDDMSLPEAQLDVVRRLAYTLDKPIILLLIEGRPRLLRDAVDNSHAVLNCYLPGIYGGLPIAEILYGKESPSGRQPFTYPKHEYQTKDVIWQGIWNEYAPQWPFGFGLSYSNLVYSNLSVDSNELRPGKPVRISLTVENTGPYKQREAVLLYTTQIYRTGYQPELFRLRRFSKIEVESGHITPVMFTLTAEELAYYNRDLVKVIDPAPINVTINALTPNERTITLNIEI